MNEQPDDQWLRTIASGPQPQLSENFDQQLVKRISQSSLTAQERTLIWIYYATAIFASVCLMRYASIPWLIILAATLVPHLLLEFVFRPRGCTLSEFLRIQLREKSAE